MCVPLSTDLLECSSVHCPAVRHNNVICIDVILLYNPLAHMSVFLHYLYLSKDPKYLVNNLNSHVPIIQLLIEVVYQCILGVGGYNNTCIGTHFGTILKLLYCCGNLIDFSFDAAVLPGCQ